MTYTIYIGSFTFNGIMNDALEAQKYRMIIERAKAANKRYLATEKGKAKGRIASHNYYNSHNKDEDFLLKKREAAKLYYANNEPYRLNRQAKAKERYFLKMNPTNPTSTESTQSI